MLCHKSLSALCRFLRHSLIQKRPQTVVVLNTLKTQNRSSLSPRRRQQGRTETDHSWTYLFNG